MHSSRSGLPPVRAAFGRKELHPAANVCGRDAIACIGFSLPFLCRDIRWNRNAEMAVVILGLGEIIIGLVLGQSSQ